MTVSTTIPYPTSPLRAALGAAFRSEREAAGKTLDATARHLGVVVNTVRWHEGGTRMLRADQIQQAAELFGCEPGKLLTATSETPTEQ